MREAIIWLAIVGMPLSIAIGGGAAYLRCRRRGELQVLDESEVVDELRRQI